MNSDATKKDAVKSGVIPVMEFNPALLLLSELNQSYSHLASFHYDSYGGDLIAVKLKQVTTLLLLAGKYPK